jgi:hypothetical protein
VEGETQVCKEINYPRLGWIFHEILSKIPTGYSGISQNDIKSQVGKEVSKKDQETCESKSDEGYSS